MAFSEIHTDLELVPLAMILAMLPPNYSRIIIPAISAAGVVLPDVDAAQVAEMLFAEDEGEVDVNALIARELSALIEYIDTGHEASALQSLAVFRAIGGLADYSEILVTPQENNPKNYSYHLLEYAISKRCTQLAMALIAEYEAPIDARERGALFPLLLACSVDDLVVIEKLIEKGVDLLAQNSDGINALMACTSKTATNLIVVAAKRKGPEFLAHMLKQKDRAGFNVLEMSIEFKYLEKFSHIISLCDDDILKQVFSRLLLDKARSSFWATGNIAFDTICEHINRVAGEKLKFKPIDFSTQTVPPTYEATYQKLFGPTPDPDHKREAIKQVITQWSVLLNSSEKCMQYFQILNNAFLEFYQHEYAQSFPELDPQSYHFVWMNGLKYPAPHEGYIGIKKHSALPKFLIGIFQRHGIAANAEKWIGFIPAESANVSLSRGDFVTEERLGNGLYHGKLAHMLQIALLLIAIERGEIQLSDTGSERQVPLAMQDILRFMIDEKSYGKSQNLWTIVVDARHLTRYTLSDPFQVQTAIMSAGQQYQLRGLADYSTDSYCKGLLRQFNEYKRIINCSTMTIDEFINKMSDTQLHLFNFQLWNALAETETTHRPNTAGAVVSAANEGSGYAIIPKRHVISGSSSGFFSTWCQRDLAIEHKPEEPLPPEAHSRRATGFSSE